ncbi:MAG: hypothetical protein AB1650_04595 [Candidatus Omnitrophota bacterium]
MDFKSAKSRIASHVLMAVSVFLFIVFKIGGPQWIEWLIDRQQFVFLNNLLGVQDALQHSPGFYAGMAESRFYGPISQVMAAIAFVTYALLYLKHASFWRHLLSVFVFFLVTKFEVLFFPPYGDAIGGPFAEAIWLSKNHFDYSALFLQPDYSQGGPRVYLFSIYPTYLAIWLTLIKQPLLMLVVLHQIVFLMIAATATMLREISRKVFAPDIAILVSGLFLFFPLVQAQAESLNMEPPTMFLIMLSAFFLFRKKIVPAALAATGAAFIKGTGILACMGVSLAALVLIFENFKESRRIRKRYIFVIIAMVFVSVLTLSLKFFIKDAHVSAGMIGMLKGLPSLMVIRTVRWFLITLGIYLGSLVIRRKYSLDEFFSSGIMYAYGALFFVLLLNFIAVSPRYQLSVYPFLAFGIVHAGSLVVRHKYFLRLIVIAMTLLAGFSSYGHFQQGVKDHVLLEGSLEYRNDLRVDRSVVDRIQSEYSSFKVVAPMQIAQMLALPELGYVHKDLDVMIYGFQCQYGGIRNYEGLSHLDASNTIFIGKESDSDKKHLIPEYPMDPSDTVLEKLSYGNKRAWIFRGGHGIEKLYRIILQIRARKVHEYSQ